MRTDEIREFTQMLKADLFVTDHGVNLLPQLAQCLWVLKEIIRGKGEHSRSRFMAGY